MKTRITKTEKTKMKILIRITIRITKTRITTIGITVFIVNIASNFTSLYSTPSS